MSSASYTSYDPTARIYYSGADGDIGIAAEQYRLLLRSQLLTTTIMFGIFLLAATTIRTTVMITPLYYVVMMYIQSRILTTYYKQLIELQDNERVRGHGIE